MGVSFQSNIGKMSVGTSYQQAGRSAEQKMRSAKTDMAKNINMSKITDSTVPYKEENDELLRKVRFSQNKMEVLGEYLGAMQTALNESGSNGIVMARRVGHMMDTEKAFEQSAVYHDMKQTDTFVKDQLEAMKAKQEELANAKLSENEQDEKSATKEKLRNTEKTIEEEITDRFSTNASQTKSTTGMVESVNTDVQKRAAGMYKNFALQENFIGMI